LNFAPEIRHNWKLEEVIELFNEPLNDLVFKAQISTRKFFDANEVQASTLLSIKTGGCEEDCKYCPQSAHYDTGLKAEKLLDKEKILSEAKKAKEMGATRFCMGAAWRSPKDRHMPELTDVVKEVKGLGLETCMTLGMLSKQQAQQLGDAGLDYYNHNIDTSEDFYKEIITTRSFKDRLDTLENVRDAGMKVCCGGIVGMGEKVDDRAKMLITLANMPTHPESVPINLLVKVAGTPLMEGVAAVEPVDFIKTIAVARILMPASYVRLSAGRENMSSEMQALCFLAGANSIFYGEKLLTTANPEKNEDVELLNSLGIKIKNEVEQRKVCSDKAA
jgi:biotin synthase